MYNSVGSLKFDYVEHLRLVRIGYRYKIVLQIANKALRLFSKFNFYFHILAVNNKNWYDSRIVSPMKFNPLNFGAEFFAVIYLIITFAVINNGLLIYLILTQTKHNIGTYKWVIFSFACYDILYSSIFGQLKIVSIEKLYGSLEE